MSQTQKLRGLDAASLRLETLNDKPNYRLNQDLCILEIMLENLYKDILAKYADFPYTKGMLYINNVRELLNGI